MISELNSVAALYETRYIFVHVSYTCLFIVVHVNSAMLSVYLLQQCNIADFVYLQTVVCEVSYTMVASGL